MADEARGYSSAGRLFGWGLAIAYLAHQVVTINLARTDRFSPAREDLRTYHYTLGTLLLLLVIGRLWAWRRDGRVGPPAGIGAGAHHWGRSLALAFYLLLLVNPVLGVLQGWADDLVLRIGPVALPQLIGHDRAVWLFTGYFHSAIGFVLLLFNVAALATAGYTLLRYGRGLLTALPPGYGALVFVGMTATVYAFSTFRSHERGVPAVLTFWAILAAVWAVGWLIHRRRTVGRGSAAVPGWARVAAPLAVLLIVAAGAYGPYAQFKVSPFTSGEMVAAPEGVTSHLTPAVELAALPPETPFERKVRAETYKWCRFCHTVEKNGRHLVGPNLYLIFGQTAGTVPNFGYTEAMAGARRRGLVWDDKTIAAYIADPQTYLPGTAMVVSSGPIPDPKVQQAIVNILKRDTMGDAVGKGATAR